MKIKFDNDWDLLLSNEINKEYFQKLLMYINNEYRNYTVYPAKENIFTALKLTNYQNVKVVIIGQDPYHQKGQSHGLAFSVPEGIKIPKSLHNIFLELVDDVNITYPQKGNLTFWAKQGVLLLNSVFTVRDSSPGSHRNKGWEIFTDQIIRLINEKEETVVYLLWGNDAKKKRPLITNKNHFILDSVHPSPLSARRGFFGCKHFSKTNSILRNNNLETINWQI